MRHAISFVAICAVVILLQARTALADHDMTCHPSPPSSYPSSRYQTVSIFNGGVQSGQEINLIMPGAGGATSSSCSSAGGDDIDVALPPDDFSAIEHILGAGQDGHYWLFDPVSQAFLDGQIGLSAELPNFTRPDGTPLLAQYSETGLVFLLQAARDFETGESLSASGGQILAWPAATLREIPAAFDLDELFPPDPSRFPLYSGVAQVADVAIFAVAPEPASARMLVALVGLLLLMRRRSNFRGFWNFADGKANGASKRAFPRLIAAAEY
jgi:hypothetical protein